MHTIEPHIDTRLLHEVQRELHLLDDSLDFALEFEGARTQIADMVQQRQDGGILDALKEKPFNTLTVEEREMLAGMTVRKNR